MTLQITLYCVWEVSFHIMKNQNIVLIVTVWFIFQILFHQLMSMRSHCFMLSLNLIISYEPSLFQSYLPLLILMCWRKKRKVHRLWWKEYEQKTYFDVIDKDVWFINSKMLDRHYIQFYMMSFFAFWKSCLVDHTFFYIFTIFCESTFSHSKGGKDCFIYISSWNLIWVDG